MDTNIKIVLFISIAMFIISLARLYEYYINLPPKFPNKYKVGDYVCYLRSNCNVRNQPVKCMITKVQYRKGTNKYYVYSIKPLGIDAVWSIAEHNIEDIWSEIYVK